MLRFRSLLYCIFLILTVLFIYSLSILLNHNNNLRGSNNNFNINKTLSLNMNNNNNNITNKKIPKNFLYGTAWKKDRTKDLVIKAITNGFRGIDTACQPKHYNEAGVGEGLKYLYNNNIITRDELFIQTKFTPLRGQDPNNIPYDKDDSLYNQVLQSFDISCSNLHTNFIDSLLLHSPLLSLQDTLEVWKAFEYIYNQGKVGYIGMSNTYDISTLEAIYNHAQIKPTMLQNRFYQDSNYDKDIRRFCLNNNIQYQSFWTLTANPHLLKSKIIKDISIKYNKTVQQVLFKFIQHLSILPLTGTSSTEHMKQDLDTDSFNLTNNEIEMINNLL